MLIHGYNPPKLLLVPPKNDGNQVGVLFIDLKKAFDSIHHGILVERFKKYGIEGMALESLKHYLKDRQQRILVNGTMSNFKDISFGVPQGSCLGPLLFLTYINDITKYVDEKALNLYADDTALIAVKKNKQLLENSLQNYANSLDKWCSHSKLKINIDKSKVMRFQVSKRARQASQNIKITVDNMLRAG